MYRKAKVILSLIQFFFYFRLNTLGVYFSGVYAFETPNYQSRSLGFCLVNWRGRVGSSGRSDPSPLILRLKLRPFGTRHLRELRDSIR